MTGHWRVPYSPSRVDEGLRRYRRYAQAAFDCFAQGRSGIQRQRDLVATAAGRTVIFQSTVCVESPSVRVSFSIGSSPSIIRTRYGVAVEGNGAVARCRGEEATKRIAPSASGQSASVSIDGGVAEAGERADAAQSSTWRVRTSCRTRIRSTDCACVRRSGCAEP